MSKKRPTEPRICTSVQPHMLTDASFAIASESADFDIWITTADGKMHGIIAVDAIQLSTKGGEGPDRLREWLMKVWFFKEWAQKPEKWTTEGLKRMATELSDIDES